jgi:PKD repeat protein
MKRTTQLLTLSVAALLATVGCVKSVEQPPLAGPSTYAHSILMTATTDTLTINGVDSTDITITSISPTGQSENIPLRAQTYINGVPIDFGTLSTKTPTTPATIRYTAPPPSALTVQSPTTVTIRVTPTSNGDFRSEFARELDLRLLPQGVIVPSNPNLIASFAVTPNPAMVLETVAFDASGTAASVNAAGELVACGTLCNYNWNFGDGGTASGLTPFHTYRSIGTYLATLTVTDPFGALAVTTRSVVVNPGTPPTVPAFTFSPPTPGIDQTIFFNATSVRPANGRTLVTFDWDFGDGSKASGMTTTHSYRSAGTYPVTLRVTDDAGSVGQVTVSVAVSATAGLPTAAFNFSPTSPAVNQQVFFDASTSRPFASNQPITTYRWDFGDGSPDEVNESNRVTHAFRRQGTYTVRLTVTDTAGKQGTTTLNVTVTP